MGMLGRKGRLALCLAMLMAQAWAEEAPSADGSQPKTVIKLPLKLKPQTAADAHKDERPSPRRRWPSRKRNPPPRRSIRRGQGGQGGGASARGQNRQAGSQARGQAGGQGRRQA